MGGPLVLERARPGPDRAGRLRALRAGPVPARRHRPTEVRRLVLTASGGPFRGRTRDELADGDARARRWHHPTWDMGPVITINSATLVNKGLEVIEAHLLFGIPFDRIEVVVHPTSVVHSMVEFVDGSTLVQASPPTMLIPIALGLAWPRPGARRRAAGRLDPGRDLGVPPARRRGLPGRRPGPPGRGGRRHRARRSTTRPTRSASRRSAPAGCAFADIVDTVAARAGAHDVPSEEHAHRRRRPRRRRAGPATSRRPARIERDPHDRRLLHCSAW